MTEENKLEEPLLKVEVEDTNMVLGRELTKVDKVDSEPNYAEGDPNSL